MVHVSPSLPVSQSPKEFAGMGMGPHCGSHWIEGPVEGVTCQVAEACPCRAREGTKR